MNATQSGLAPDSAAIVTGAERNIGAAIARRLAEAGYAVAVTHRDEDKAAAGAESVVASIVAEGGRAISAIADVTDPTTLDSMVAHVATTLGDVRVLVNNAATAVARDQPWDADDAQDWEAILRVNVTGAYLCAKAVVPRMQSGASIVNISSIRALVGLAGNLAYNTSKAAITGLTRSLARELGASGIRVNAVLPGAIDTPEQAAVYGEPLPAAERTDQALPIVGTPGDIAHAVAFLVSDQARFITGQSLVVDGGWIMH